jgi:hypothetical protein
MKRTSAHGPLLSGVGLSHAFTRTHTRTFRGGWDGWLFQRGRSFLPQLPVQRPSFNETLSISHNSPASPSTPSNAAYIPRPPSTNQAAELSGRPHLATADNNAMRDNIKTPPPRDVKEPTLSLPLPHLSSIILSLSLYTPRLHPLLHFYDPIELTTDQIFRPAASVVRTFNCRLRTRS